VQRREHVLNGVVVEHEPVLVAGGLGDCVGEPAGMADHRDGTIAQGDHLRQSAGLTQRRHEEDVAAAVDEASEVGAEGDHGLHVIPDGRYVAEEVGKPWLAGAHKDELGAMQVRQGLDDKVEPLDGIQTRDHPNEWGVWTNREARELL